MDKKPARFPASSYAGRKKRLIVRIEARSEKDAGHQLELPFGVGRGIADQSERGARRTENDDVSRRPKS
jgi:hypothetical protein